MKQFLKQKNFSLWILFILTFFILTIGLFNLLRSDVDHSDIQYVVQQENDLSIQIEDLRRIRESLKNELMKFESQRNGLLNELNDLEDKLLKFKVKFEQIEKQNEFIDAKFLFQKSKEIEIENRLRDNLELIKKTEDFKQNIEIHDVNINLNHEYQSIDACFNYNKCRLNSPLKIYYLNDGGNISNDFERVNSAEESCLNVLFLRENVNISNFTAIQNLLVVDLRSGANKNDFKCGLYASFNTNAFISNSNLFFHFSIIDLHLNDALFGIQNNNQQQNNLLLTHDRKHLLSYHDTTGNTIKLSKLFQIDTNCVSDSSGFCFESPKRLEILSNSSFTFIFNRNSSMLWTIDSTIRLIEALSVGTIPIILDLSSKLPLSEHINWDEIVIRLPLKYIQYLEGILLNFNTADLIDRRVKATKIYNSYFKTPSIQFQTLISFVRERLRLPAVPFKETNVQENSFPQITDTSSVVLEYFNITLDDEYLGPVYKNSTLNQLFKSKSYQYNFTFNNYQAWNVYYSPFNLFPSTPFDKFLPTNLKYTSIITNLTQQDTHYYFGGTYGGKYFNYKLAGNHDDNEQFTIIILTFNRERLLTAILLQYLNLPYLNQIVIIWNSLNTKPSDQFYIRFKNELETNLIRLVFSQKNSLNNRFLPYDCIQTDAVLSLDDDTLLRNDEIIFAFRVWRENRDRLIGFAARFHTWNATTGSYIYRSDYTCEYSMILTGAAMYHRFYNFYYSYKLDKRIHEKIDTLMNCEDIAFNYMVSDMIHKPPIKVTSKWRFYCDLCNQTQSIQPAFSSNPTHYKTRSDCINFFNLHYGYNPLLYSQTRMDSVLFKTKIPTDHQKCYKIV